MDCQLRFLRPDHQIPKFVFSLSKSANVQYEVFKRFLILHNEDEALKVVGIMSTGNVSQLTREISIDATLISKENQLAMADSIILATAKAYGAMLCTQAKDFSEFEGVQYRKS